MDINKYTANKEFIVTLLTKNPPDDVVRFIAEMSSATMCPCIATAYWVGEALNWPEVVTDHIKSLTKFYNYAEIVGKPQGSPV